MHCVYNARVGRETESGRVCVGAGWLRDIHTVFILYSEHIGELESNCSFVGDSILVACARFNVFASRYIQVEFQVAFPIERDCVRRIQSRVGVTYARARQ